MNARAVLKSAATLIAHYSGIGKALGVRYRGPGVIFVLHSVIGGSIPYLEDLRCPVDVLERTLSWLKCNGFAFVSLDQALARLADPGDERFCAFTFDDGYADNLTYALPLMERFAAPFTVYVSSGMMTGEIDAWWLGLAALVRTRDAVAIPELDLRLDCADHAGKRRAYLAIEARIHANYDALGPVKAAIAASGIDCGALARREGLSAAQLRQLAASPLVTIGAHTARHINLALAPAREVEQEMVTGRRALESILGHEVVHFAYPFGNARACGPREAQIAREVGFRSAVTMRRGMLFPEHRHHLYALPREPLTGRETPVRLQCKLDGVDRALQSLLSRSS